MTEAETKAHLLKAWNGLYTWLIDETQDTEITRAIELRANQKAQYRIFHYGLPYNGEGEDDGGYERILDKLAEFGFDSECKHECGATAHMTDFSEFMANELQDVVEITITSPYEDF